jgi:hypothetical protein
MSLFKHFRKTATVTFKGEDFTLYEPSALNRTLHLQRIEKTGKESNIEFDDQGNPLITLELIKVNLESSADLISICMAPGFEELTIEELYADIMANSNKEFIEAFYPVAESLAYEKAPEETDNPKPDPALDSATD